VMGGAMRMAFHGVPRIIENTFPEYLLPHNVPEHLREAMEYLKDSRINVNIRQVLKENEPFPEEIDNGKQKEIETTNTNNYSTE